MKYFLTVLTTLWVAYFMVMLWFHFPKEPSAFLAFGVLVAVLWIAIIATDAQR